MKKIISKLLLIALVLGYVPNMAVDATGIDDNTVNTGASGVQYVLSADEAVEDWTISGNGSYTAVATGTEKYGGERSLHVKLNDAYPVKFYTTLSEPMVPGSTYRLEYMMKNANGSTDKRGCSVAYDAGLIEWNGIWNKATTEVMTDGWVKYTYQPMAVGGECSTIGLEIWDTCDLYFDNFAVYELDENGNVIETLTVTNAGFENGESSGPIDPGEPPVHDVYETIILACSDFQNTTSSQAGAQTVNNIIDTIEASGIQGADAFFCCGDYANTYGETEPNLNILKSAVIDFVPDEDSHIYVQGNHDADIGTQGLAQSGNNDTEDYGVFVINEDDYMWYNSGKGRIKQTAGNLANYLNEKLAEGFDKPIFVLSHLPLYKSLRTTNDGDAKYANYLFHVLNQAGEQGLNIIFMSGHDHSSGYESYLGGSAVYLKKGDSINIPQGSKVEFREETLNFTYMNAGYVGYYAAASGRDSTLNMSLVCIDEDTDTVDVYRYDENGLHNLKSAGVLRTAEVAAGEYEPDTTIYTSPQTIDLTAVNYEYDIETLEDPADNDVTAEKPDNWSISGTGDFNAVSTELEAYEGERSLRITLNDAYPVKFYTTLSEPMVPGSKYCLQYMMKDAEGSTSKRTASVAYDAGLIEWNGIWNNGTTEVMTDGWVKYTYQPMAVGGECSTIGLEIWDTCDLYFDDFAVYELDENGNVIKTLTVTNAGFENGESSGPIDPGEPPVNDVYETIILACSDFQNTTSSQAGAQTVNNIIDTIEASGIQGADAFFCCGDYANTYGETEPNLNILKSAVIDFVPDEDSHIYVQGNHDADIGTQGLAQSGNNDPENGEYGVFVINEDDYMWYNSGKARIKQTAGNLANYLNEKLAEGFDKPIFVLSHLPLYKSLRTTNDGDAKYANYLFHVLNQAGEQGLNIIFMSGHDHSSGYESYLGGSAVYLKKGDSINIPQGSRVEFREETLNFTYMNAGYVGYCNAPADSELNMTVFGIDEDTDTVDVYRFDDEGLHNLKSAGVLKNEEVGQYEADTTIYTSPQTIDLTAVNYEYDIETLEDPADNDVTAEKPDNWSISGTGDFNAVSTELEAYEGERSLRITLNDAYPVKFYTTLSEPMVPGLKYCLQYMMKDAEGSTSKRGASVAYDAGLIEWNGIWNKATTEVMENGWVKYTYYPMAVGGNTSTIGLEIWDSCDLYFDDFVVYELDDQGNILKTLTVTNAGFEDSTPIEPEISELPASWIISGAGSYEVESTNKDSYEGDKSFHITLNDAYPVKFYSSLSEPMVAGSTYRLEYMMKNANGSTDKRTASVAYDAGLIEWNGIWNKATTEVMTDGWVKYTYYPMAVGGETSTIGLEIWDTCDLYFDDFKVYQIDGSGNVIKTLTVTNGGFEEAKVPEPEITDDPIGEPGRIIDLMSGYVYYKVDSEGYIDLETFTPSQAKYYSNQGSFYKDYVEKEQTMISFITDTSTVSFDYKKETDEGYVEVFIDGEKEAEISANSLSDKGTFSIELDGEEHRVDIYLPRGGLLLRDYTTEDGSALVPVTGRTKAMFYGDSITYGYGLDHASDSYASRLAQKMDYEVVNYGVPGYYFDGGQVIEQSVFDPDIIFVAYGRNDITIFGANVRQGIAEKGKAFMDKLREIYPTQHIYMISPIWANNGATADYYDDGREAVAELASNYSNITVIDGATLVPPNAAYFPDGVHPNVSGNKLYAKNLAKALGYTGDPVITEEPEEWTISGSGSYTAFSTDERTFAGERSLHIKKDDAETTLFYTTLKDTIPAGTRFRLEYHVRRADGSQGDRPSATVLHEGGWIEWNAIHGDNATCEYLEDGWMKVTYTNTATTDLSTLGLEIWDAVEYYFDDFKLYKVDNSGNVVGSVLMNNGGIENADESKPDDPDFDETINVWTISGVGIYEAKATNKVAYEGERSLHINLIDAYPVKFYTTLSEPIVAGKKYRLEYMMKTASGSTDKRAASVAYGAGLIHWNGIWEKATTKFMENGWVKYTYEPMTVGSDVSTIGLEIWDICDLYFDDFAVYEIDDSGNVIKTLTVTNGGFEEPMIPVEPPVEEAVEVWTISGTGDYKAVSTDAEKYSEDKSLHITLNDALPVKFYAPLSEPMVSGVTYRLEYMMKNTNGSTDKRAASVAYDAGLIEWNGIWNKATTEVMENGWVKYTYEPMTVGSDVSTIGLEIWDTCDLYFDDFVVYEIDAEGNVINTLSVINSGFENDEEYQPEGPDVPECSPVWNLAVSNVTENGATLTWNGSIGAEKVLVYRKNGDEWEAVDEISPEITSMTLENLMYNTEYTYKLVPVNSIGSEAAGTEITFTTKLPDYVITAPEIFKENSQTNQIQSGSYTAKITVKNYKFDSMPCTLAVAVYKNGAIEKLFVNDENKTVTKISANGEGTIITTPFVVGEGEGHTVEVFVLETMESLYSLYPCIVLN